VNKTRKAFKYSAAAAATAMYGMGITYVLQTDSLKLLQQGTNRRKVVATATLLTALTWTATLL
jgi:hypothetical protein